MIVNVVNEPLGPVPTMTVRLPMTARELETRLHAYCDHHGWDTIVLPDEGNKEKPNAD